MVFIRKNIKEDVDWNSTLPSEVVDAGIEALQNQDINSTSMPTSEEVINEEEVAKERTYNWHDILEVLSYYMHPDIIRQIEDDWMFNYPDDLMNQDAVDDLLSDIAVSFNEETADEIKSKLDQLQDPKAVAALDLSTDIGILQDALDKISDINIKEKLVNLIDSLK